MGAQVRVPRRASSRISYVRPINHDCPYFSPADTDPLLDDDRVLVLSDRDDLRELSVRDSRKQSRLRSPHVSQTYAGKQSFTYFVLPLDPTSALPAHRVDLATPPHVVLIRTGAKLMRVYGSQPVGDDTMDRELVQRRENITQDPPFFASRQLGIILALYGIWTRLGYISPTFKSGESDATLVEEVPVIPVSCSPKRSRSPVIDLCLEPQRRVTSRELNQEPEDDDSGSELEDDSNPTWAVDVQQWADTTSHTAECDDELLVSGILDEGLEQPRTLASVDLDQPDYLKHNKRRRVA
ncbi:hypothetical protein C8F01DRAFT_282928 [Mycena amicta]|nr:hypothetical protein C8F01DRAFT_282928 [Mycena amicta]